MFQNAYSSKLPLVHKGFQDPIPWLTNFKKVQDKIHSSQSLSLSWRYVADVKGKETFSVWNLLWSRKLFQTKWTHAHFYKRFRHYSQKQDSCRPNTTHDEDQLCRGRTCPSKQKTCLRSRCTTCQHGTLEKLARSVGRESWPTHHSSGRWTSGQGLTSLTSYGDLNC